MIELEQMQLIKGQMAPEMNTILIIKSQRNITQSTVQTKNKDK